MPARDAGIFNIGTSNWHIPIKQIQLFASFVSNLIHMFLVLCYAASLHFDRSNTMSKTMGSRIFEGLATVLGEKPLLRVATVGLGALALAGCRFGGDTTPPPPSPETSVSTSFVPPADQCAAQGGQGKSCPENSPPEQQTEQQQSSADDSAK